MLGMHCLKTWATTQAIVALSSAEAELYAMVAASAETLAIIAYAGDLGMKAEGEINIRFVIPFKEELIVRYILNPYHFI